ASRALEARQPHPGDAVARLHVAALSSTLTIMTLPQLIGTGLVLALPGHRRLPSTPGEHAGSVLRERGTSPPPERGDEHVRRHADAGHVVVSRRHAEAEVVAEGGEAGLFVGLSHAVALARLY